MFPPIARIATLLFLSAGTVLAQTPAAITPNAVRQTKEATVYLKVTTAGGQTTEGSGFLAIEPGIVITNAHVVGMLQASSKPPTKVDVVLHSGEANELQLVGKLLGVDRTNDLAVLRVEGKLPAPLQLSLKEDLFETQKVYIFGFPFGAELGKNITVSESSVSSLRKNAGGTLEQIQVNGGMHPGNSGGPVVNSLGQVVGVSVAGIRSTQINFAIPAPAVKSLLEGRILDTKAGELFQQKGEIHVPLVYNTLDPFRRIKEIRVEVWAGERSANRAFSPEKAQPQKGDGTRQSHNLTQVDASASGEVPLPKLTANQVAWVQPILVFAKGDPIYGQPVSYDTASAVERIPADLTIKLAQQKERTLHMTSSQSITLSKGKLRFVVADRAELDILESFGPDQKGARVRTAFGLPSLSFEEDGKKLKLPLQVSAMLQRIPPSFVIDETNKLRSRTNVTLNPKVAPTLRQQTSDFLTQICNAYEATTFIMPNRKLQPRDTWEMQVPMLVKLTGNSEVLDLMLTCTFEGTRTRGDSSEALVSFEGKTQGRGDMKGKMNGQVAGKFTFDLKRSFITTVKLTISSESTSANDVHALFAFDVDLTRVEGNPRNIEMPKAGPTPTTPKGTILLTRNSALSPRDTPDREFGARGSRMQIVPIDFEQGKKYTITLNSDAFDCYLRLVDPTGKIVAEDDDSGGGLNSRIDHTAAQAGSYKIVATSFDGKLGAFELQVFGDKGGLAKIDDPKTKVDLSVKTFTKPAKSETPTAYLKIVSAPGDYIGQGKTYDYKGNELIVKVTPRGVNVRVDGWSLDIGAPNGQFLQVGEFRDAKRFPFSGPSPGLSFAGKGRGSNTLTGEFVVWELEVENGQIVKAAIDFVQRDNGKGPPLTGKLRVNSTLE